MNIENTLRKEGIEIIKAFDTLKVNIIAKKISDMLCKAFPEHGFSSSDLFMKLSRLPMYSAKMKDQLAKAKYFYKNNSIYFNADYPLETSIVSATHECIHYLQKIEDNSGNVTGLGFYNFATEKGMALNEATVQLMTMECCHEPISEVKYYGLDLKTSSPSYYPLECVLVNQMAFFTGSYPLYHSCLTGGKLFENTFSTFSGKKTYSTIVKNLDKILMLEGKLDESINYLQTTDSDIEETKKMYEDIQHTKNQITKLFLETQNKIISTCFSFEFYRIKSLQDVKEYQNRLYAFKNLIGTCDTYNFYNNFYIKAMENLEKKKDKLEKFGQFEINSNASTDLTVITPATKAFSLWRRIIAKLKFGKNREELL